MLALFDSWEPDAVPRDKASGIYFDRAKMHVLDQQSLVEPRLGLGLLVVNSFPDYTGYDLMEEWFTTGAADGFNIQPPCIPASAEVFVELVTPELQRRGLFRREYETVTLRQHLGLRPATNRHVVARQMRQAG